MSDHSIVIIWVMKIFFVLFCVLLSPLLNIFCFCTSISFLSFIVPIFAWNVPLVSIVFLKRSLIFPILLFFAISFHWSPWKPLLSLLSILWNSAFKWISFLFSFVFSIGLICPDAIRQGPRARSYIKILLPICKETPDSCFIRDFQGKTSLRKMAEVLMACPGPVPMEGSKCTAIEGTVKMYIFWFTMQKFDCVYL